MPHPSSIFVGFGFGPIQSGLFLLEAFLSGNFRRYVVAEVDPTLVAAIRNNRGRYTINIARKDRIDPVTVEGVELYNPTVADDRARLVEAIASADELATALPSVDFYDRGGPAAITALLSDGLARRDPNQPAVIYTAENHNHAAEILTEKLPGRSAASTLTGESATRPIPPVGAPAADHIAIVNTVIGKMSGVIGEAAMIARLGLSAIAPGMPRAVLVEEFNRILIGRIHLPGFERGIRVFVEKDDLLPFEEAKLYGHNAIHALIGYLAQRRGLATMAQAASHRDIMAIARHAFINECGTALIARHGHRGDSLFTPAGYAAYADDLLDRMVRANLNDMVGRVTRDQVRKLGYDDRFFGAMRLALSQGIEPVNMAKGAAAAVLSLIEQEGDCGQPRAFRPNHGQSVTQDITGKILTSIWGNRTDPHSASLIRLTWEAMGQ